MPEERIPTSVVSHLKYPFEFFNPAQSLVVPHKDEDVNVVCAFRTSAGKTVCAELMMDSALRKGKKAIYTSPLKALSQEKYDDWTSSKHAFSQYKVSILTGDYRLTDARVRELKEANIIILTSEMLDSRCRRMEAERNDWLLDCGIIIVDECQLLGISDRGDALESGLMKFTALNPNARIVFLSATVANSEEFANWATFLNGKKSAHLRSDYRPCPLTKHYVGYPDKGKYADKEKAKIKAAIEVLQENDKDHFIFFVHGKDFGEKFLKELQILGYSAKFHNADLDKEARLQVESDFRAGKLEHLVATSTLCLHPKVTIATSAGPKEIQYVKKGDFVLTHTGRFEEVLGTTTRNFKGSLLKIKVAGRLPVRMTPEHRVLCSHRRKTGYNGRLGSWAYTVRTEPEWLEASKLKVNDEVLYPIPKVTPEIKEIQIHSKIFVGRNQFGSVFKHPYAIDVPMRITPDRDLVELFGVYVAEGFTGKNGVVGFAVATYEDKLTEFIVKTLKKKFNVNVTITDSTRHRRKIVCCSRVLAEFFRNSFGTGARSKKFPEFLMHLPNDLLTKLLRGAWRGDGNIAPKKEVLASYGTVSPQLAQQIDLILLRLGYVSTVYYGKPKRKSLGKLPFYQIRLAGTHGREFLKKVFRIPRNKFKKINREYTTMPFVGDSARLPVKNIRKVPYSGKVYNLHVKNDESYVTQFVVHNSWGVNLPARRVLVMGVHRGMKIVDPLDIIQEFGRAGRPGFDTEGDAYLLVPQSKALHFKTLVETEPTIKSQMLDVEVLAFHLITDIEKKEVRTLEDIQHWYERSFAKFQGESLKPNLVDEVVRRLEQIGAIKIVEGAYECQAIGKIAAWFYQSPFDVAQWKGNFERIFRRTKNPDEMDMAWAISHVDSYLQKTWLHKDDELKAVDLQREYWRRGYSFDKKATSIVYGLISHLKSKGIPTRGRGAIFQIVIDAERIVDTIKTVGTYTKAYDPDGKFWEVFSLRLQTGASKEMVPLVQLDGVGPKRAGMLLKENIKSPGDVMASATKVKEVLGEKIGASVIEAANKLIRNPHANLY